jgi:tetratricopeptide (TPR) repeat protein
MTEIAFDRLVETIEVILHGDVKTFLIIDGIDELPQQMLELELFIRTLERSQTTGNGRVLIVSRPTPTVESLLASWKRIEIRPSDSMHDISLFLENRIGDMIHLGNRRDEVIERLLDSSKGLFLWANLATSELDHLRTWNDVSALLDNGNNGLYELYVSIMRQLDTSSEGLSRLRARVLPLVAIACRPLFIEELLELLAVELNKSSVDPGNRLLDGWATISKACGPLLLRSEPGNDVELIHITAKDFVLSQDWSEGLAKDAFTGDSADAEMACLCLSYLNFNVFQRTPFGEVEIMDAESLAKQYPLLGYASQFWSDHFTKSSSITQLHLSLLEQFLNSPSGEAWSIASYPFSSRLESENHRTVFRSRQSIIAKLKRKLRASGETGPANMNRCIEKCNRLLLESVQKSLHMERFHSGPQSRTTLERKLSLVECFSALNEFDMARDIAFEALKSATEVLGEKDPLTLQLRHAKLRTQMQTMQRISTTSPLQLLPELEDTVEQHKAVFGKDHVETLSCLHDTALVHFISQDIEKTQTLLEPLHQKMIEKLGRTSRVTHLAANNLASCANMQKKFDYAEKILLTIPELSKAVEDPLEIDLFSVHAYTLLALSIFAAIVSGRGEFQRSEMLHQRVIDGFTALEGPKARSIYESAINKGQAMRDQFKYKEARKHYLKWLKQSDQYFTSESRFSKNIRGRLEDLDNREKRWKEKNDYIKFLDIHGQPVKERRLVFMLAMVILSLALVGLIWCRLLRWR